MTSRGGTILLDCRIELESATGRINSNVIVGRGSFAAECKSVTVVCSGPLDVSGCLRKHPTLPQFRSSVCWPNDLTLQDNPLHVSDEAVTQANVIAVKQLVNMTDNYPRVRRLVDTNTPVSKNQSGQGSRQSRPTYVQNSPHAFERR